MMEKFLSFTKSNVILLITGLVLLWCTFNIITLWGNSEKHDALLSQKACGVINPTVQYYATEDTTFVQVNSTIHGKNYNWYIPLENRKIRDMIEDKATMKSCKRLIDIKVALTKEDKDIIDKENTFQGTFILILCCLFIAVMCIIMD